MTEHKPQIDISDDDFGTILNCAVRYACGRKSYMSGLVIDYITPLLQYLSPEALGCMERDIRNGSELFGGWGNEIIDKPEWMNFLGNIQKVMEVRNIPKWR